VVPGAVPVAGARARGGGVQPETVVPTDRGRSRSPGKGQEVAGASSRRRRWPPAGAPAQLGHQTGVAKRCGRRLR
jgi:hypothetical protein